MISQTFREKLENRVEISNSLLCIGLDPHISQLPDRSPSAAREFCEKIINETHEFAACYKPNIAFFEYFGEEGLIVLRDIVKIIPGDIPIILDAKRGDIDTTAQAYADSAFNVIGADSVTLSPYMGWDSTRPFVTGDYRGKGAFILCKTSNKSSSEIQYLKLIDGSYVFERVLDSCMQWQRFAEDSLIGVVAGATDTISLKLIREKAPNIWILCPGVGAQGGELSLVCPAGLRADGSGLLISVSRAISSADNMAMAARSLRDEINLLRNQRIATVTTISTCAHTLHPYQREFIHFAVEQEALQFGSFQLKSGRISPYFFNAGNLCSGQSIHMLGRCYAQAIRESGVQFDVIFGPAYKGIPLATALSVAWFQIFGESKDIAYNRKEIKDHGEGGQLVGASVTGKRVLIIDDVITAGTAIRESVAFLSKAGADIVGAVVSLDRQERSGEENLSAIQQVESDYHFPVFPIIRLEHLVKYIEEKSSEHTESFSVHLEAMYAYRSAYGA